MKKMKLWLTVMMVVAIVALSVGCPHIPTKPLPILEAPTITVAAGENADWLDFTTKNITIESTTGDITFYYTIDGSTPTISSQKQFRTESSNTTALTSADVLLEKYTSTATTFTLKVLAVKKDHTNSAVTEMTFNKKGTVATPTITPDGGNFTQSFQVELTCDTPESKIYYTLDSTDPTDESTLYTGKFTVAEAITVKAIAYRETSKSAIASATFTREKLTSPTIDPVHGSTFTKIQDVTLTIFDGTPEGATILYSLDSTTPSIPYSEPFSIDTTTTVKAMVRLEGYTDSDIVSATFTLDGTPVISIPEGASEDAFDYSKDITFSNAVQGASYRYTVNGADPTVSETVATNNKINLNTLNVIAGEAIVKVIAEKDGAIIAPMVTRTFTQAVVAKPNITFGTADAAKFDYNQDITFESATTGVNYNYTITNGAGDELKTGTESPINLTNLTVKESPVTVTIIAKRLGYANSIEAQQVFTKMLVVAPISITPAEGSREYQDSVDITLACETEGAVITYKIGDGGTEQTYVQGKPFTVGSAANFNATVKITATATKENHATATETAIFTKKGFIKTVLVEVDPEASFEVNVGATSTLGLSVTDVTLTKNYQMGVYEVTQSQYNLVLELGENTINLPKANITHLDAVKFCNALSIKEGLTSYYQIVGTDIKPLDDDGAAKYGYRLPTEVEWDYAAREGLANSDYTYSGSNTEEEVAHPSKTGKVNEVGILMPNALGIYDMSGNIAEMCFDFWVNKSYPVNFEAIDMIDPVGVNGTYSGLGEGGTPTVRRGGSQGTTSKIESTEVWKRASLAMGGKNAQTGFRVVRTVE